MISSSQNFLYLIFPVPLLPTLPHTYTYLRLMCCYTQPTWAGAKIFKPESFILSTNVFMHGYTFHLHKYMTRINILVKLGSWTKLH